MPFPPFHVLITKRPDGLFPVTTLLSPTYNRAPDMKDTYSLGRPLVRGRFDAVLGASCFLS